MNTCNKCDLVQYCNAACKKKHRHKHKKKCEKRAAELHDEQLFKEPPLPEECPICMLPPPIYEGYTGTTFHTCCGKSICDGCMYAMRGTGGNNMKLCAYCRTPPTGSNGETIKRINELMEKGNAKAFNVFASYYARGMKGMPQDRIRANDLFLKAGELGCAMGYYNLGLAYNFGRGVEVDVKTAKHYYELAAIKGDVDARHNLGVSEYNAGNPERAYKHYIISASAGCRESLDCVKEGYKGGHITKDQYAQTLRAYQTSQDEMKSDARDKAKALHTMFIEQPQL